MTRPKKTKRKANYAPGSHGCHEALHMAAFVLDVIDRELVEHPAIKHTPKYRKLAVAGLDAIYELYQAIGADHLE